MEKNIVLLSDGTGNAASSPHKTNVWRLYEALDLSPPALDAAPPVENDFQQLAFYDDGVGTSKFLPTRLIGLAFGWGLKKNVKQLYLSLCRVYEPGDNIYIFGFSRGAFTARVVAGLIASQGIVRHDGDEKKLRKKVDTAYVNFRLDEFGVALAYFPIRTMYQCARALRNKLQIKKKQSDKNDKPQIKMIGVWDTVDAYGSPIDELTRAWDRIVWPLSAKDRNLSSKIRAAYHALALDEQRESFNPMLWNEAPEEDKKETNKKYNVVAHESKEKINEEQILEQVWFSGVHANVGGGYPDDSLAHVSLDWMITKCEKHDLRFNDAVIDRYRHRKNANGKIYNNRSGIGNLYRYAPRKIEELCNNKQYTIQSICRNLMPKTKNIRNHVRIECPKIHESVFERIRSSGNAYAPTGIPEHYCTVDDDGNESIAASSTDNKTQTMIKPIISETKEQAKIRRDQQGSLWKNVWLGKILYITTLSAIIFYLFFPWLYTDTEVQQTSTISATMNPKLGGIGEFIHLLPKTIGSIPGLGVVGEWAERYQQMPYMFVLVAVLILILLMTSKFLHRHIQEEMRQNWSHVAGDKLIDAGRSASSNLFTGIFDSRVHKRDDKVELSLSITDWTGYIFRLFAELIFILLLILIIAVGIWRTEITISDSNGLYCKVPGSSTNNLATAITFIPTDTCFDTGVDLEAGKKYKLSFEIDQMGFKNSDIATCDDKLNRHPWCDHKTKADARGWFGSTPIQYRVGSIMKRHITKDWYEPIAKIGNDGLYRFSFESPVNLNQPSNKPVWKTTVSIDVTRNGRLFIYLNDAIIPPFLRNMITVSNDCSARQISTGNETKKKSDMWALYSNNCGTATIKVDPLYDNDTDASPPPPKPPASQ